MNKNFFLTLTALAVMTTLGYAAYTNGSITDLSDVVNNKAEELTSASSNYLGAVLSTQKLATSTTKAAGTRERFLPGTLKIIKNDSTSILRMPTIETRTFLYKFSITARKNSSDPIKYFDFEINGGGVATSTQEGIILDIYSDKDMTQKIGSRVGSVTKENGKKLVVRFGNWSILAGESHYFSLSAYIKRVNEKTPISVRILKIDR